LVGAGTAAPTNLSSARSCTPRAATALAITTERANDGTLTVTLHKRSALSALNASLVSYGLKAKLPRGVSDRTVALTATCLKIPTLPGKGHPAAVGPPHAPVPAKPQRLKNCVLHAKS